MAQTFWVPEEGPIFWRPIELKFGIVDLRASTNPPAKFKRFQDCRFSTHFRRDKTVTRPLSTELFQKGILTTQSSRKPPKSSCYLSHLRQKFYLSDSSGSRLSPLIDRIPSVLGNYLYKHSFYPSKTRLYCVRVS